MKKFNISLLLVFIFSISAIAQESVIESKKVLGGYNYFMNGKALNLSQMDALMQSDKEAYPWMSKGKSQNDVASVIGFIGGGLIGWPLGAALAGAEPNWNLAVVGLGFLAVSLPLSAVSTRNIQTGVEIYNNNLETVSLVPTPTLEIGVGGNGIGLVMRF